MTVSRRTSAFETVSLGEIGSAGSRHAWTRSSVRADADRVVVGRWNGTVSAFDFGSGSATAFGVDGCMEATWERDHPESAVTLATIGDAIVVGGRGERGTIAAYDAESGDGRWSYETAGDIGEATRDSVFHLPYVVDLVSGDDRLYAAARRYERDGEAREWHSAVYAFDPDGTVRWTYRTDASPIGLSLGEYGGSLAIGYNRCAGEHDSGLVVLETATGEPEWTWDPGTDGDRRVGDVSFDGEVLAVASHGDKRGYSLGPGGEERWRVDLAVEVEIDGETLYAYPNHAYANDGRVAFVTGNTYAVESRETERRHPNEHRIAAFDAAGDRLWDAGVAGFVHGVATDGDRLVAPCAQNFRVRDPESHALRRFDLADGERGIDRFDGIATAAAVHGDRVAAIEEPVEYHDEGVARGEYALHVGSVR